jgi:hypothetical protein
MGVARGIAATFWRARQLYAAAAAAAVVASGFGISDSFAAARIDYQVTEIDATSNTWQFAYTVSGVTFGNSGSGTPSEFVVSFDPALYSNLGPSPTSPNADWFVFTTPTDPITPADGEYNAQALVDSASIADVFSISFVWQGAGTPGSQSFQLLDANFAVVDSGQTTLSDSGGGGTTPMPEPATLLLFASCTAALSALRFARRV